MQKSWHRNAPFVERVRKRTRRDKGENDASWALFASVRNMVVHGSASTRLSHFLTEDDIPEAPHKGKNPTTLNT